MRRELTACTPYFKKHYTYDIRYNKNGYSVCATNKNLETAKKIFIEKLKIAKPVNKSKPIYKNFDEFTIYYFEKFRKPKIAELTYKNDLYRYKNHIKPVLGQKSIESITPADYQALIDSLSNKGKGKTATEVFSLLSIIFKSALLHRVITYNPLSIVVKTQHEGKHGRALTKEEEIQLLDYFKETQYETLFAVVLYTGLRPNEYETARIENNFIIAVNSKRKNKKVEYKRIPITPMLAPYLQDVEQIQFPTLLTMRKQFKKVFPNHILYDLRTIFYTRCKECDISDAVRDEFVGHSLGVLGNAYTDLSDEYLLREGTKFKY